MNNLLSLNTLISFLVILVVVFLMKILQKERFVKYPKEMCYFAALYMLFVVAINQYPLTEIGLMKWISITTILYIVLDDILHREFNLIGALFVIILNFFSDMNIYLPVLAVVMILTMLTVWLIERKTKRKQGKDLSVIGGMSNGDPWLIIAFTSFIAVNDWIPYFFISWLLMILGFAVQYVRKKQGIGLPLAPMLMLSGLVLSLSGYL